MCTEQSIGRETAAIKRFSFVKLGGCAEAMVISRELNVTGTSKLCFFAARLHTSFVAAALARFLSRYTQHSRMQPVAVARKLKVTYCSSLREPTRREAAFASFQTAYILLEQFLAILA